MKIKTSLAAAIISVVAIPAFASLGYSESQAEQLTEGVTPSEIILTGGFAHEYVLSLNESSEVKIASEHPGSSNFTLHMKAKLMDASGNIVSEANSVNGVFKIDERLDAGEYRLIVSGKAGGHGEDDTHQYSLHVGIQ
ncbi:hypothetical protein HMEPL2_16450 [Vreelandella aquamarina]|uniref:Uncharacterized protein n=1 Tax=Vreelandella aquamarina TaxID=77097 RepID=A0A6F8XC33_9GAMM|nr:hypothetical protein [Halomonas meridiana]BCB71294.1 hypothetical protein HMEPL2_16450 [Halomonas meridiana]